MNVKNDPIQESIEKRLRRVRNDTTKNEEKKNSKLQLFIAVTMALGVLVGLVLKSLQVFF